VLDRRLADNENVAGKKYTAIEMAILRWYCASGERMARGRGALRTFEARRCAVLTAARGNSAHRKASVRCAINTPKFSEEGLDQELNSLQARREACEAFINSHRHQGWVCLPACYDDGGFSGATMERTALQQRAGRVDIVVVYKIDRLTRSLADFARLVEIFDT
jgi:Resolvase, N terminal domain